MRKEGEKKGKRGREGGGGEGKRLRRKGGKEGKGGEGKRLRRKGGKEGEEASFTASSSHARHIPKTQDSYQGEIESKEAEKSNSRKLHRVQ